ncbi:MAG: efflux RND transporter periplasmic adaptor subunit [Bacteroidota bacterium]
MKKDRLYLLLFFSMAVSCHSKTADEAVEKEVTVTTPVTITPIITSPMAEYIELNATSTFLQKAYVKASSNGYINSVNAQIGKIVSASQTIFVLKTKEAQSIGNTINLLDSSFKFSGIINIKAGTAGYVSEINHQAGDYVQEGEQLAVISDLRSFVFILNLPYELRPYVLNKETVELYLPDGKTMTALISSSMPVVDSASQTQNIILKVSDQTLPTNLIAKVRVIKTAKTVTVSLPKQSVLSDETQTNFWVMKVLDDSTAVKVPVTKGMEVNGRIEILTPKFEGSDRFLLTGNYGLEDTAKIRIIQQ